MLIGCAGRTVRWKCSHCSVCFVHSWTSGQAVAHLRERERKKRCCKERKTRIGEKNIQQLEEQYEMRRRGFRNHSHLLKMQTKRRLVYHLPYHPHIPERLRSRCCVHSSPFYSTCRPGMSGKQLKQHSREERCYRACLRQAAAPEPRSIHLSVSRPAPRWAVVLRPNKKLMKLCWQLCAAVGSDQKKSYSHSNSHISLHYISHSKYDINLSRPGEI